VNLPALLLAAGCALFGAGAGILIVLGRVPVRQQSNLLTGVAWACLGFGLATAVGLTVWPA
jgi:hypothetical protein